MTILYVILFTPFDVFVFIKTEGANGMFVEITESISFWVTFGVLETDVLTDINWVWDTCI